MNIRHSLAFIAVASSLASCVYPPPQQRHPRRPGTGVNLDKPASGERSPRETRYLEEEVSQAPQAQNAPTTPATTDATTPSGDTAAVQAPSGATPPPPTPPTTAETEKKDATTPPAAPAAAELPYGKPVPGKKGFVYSPYDQAAGFVDVRDISPGTKVRCPYTGKIFRVP